MILIATNQSINTVIIIYLKWHGTAWNLKKYLIQARYCMDVAHTFYLIIDMFWLVLSFFYKLYYKYRFEFETYILSLYLVRSKSYTSNLKYYWKINHLINFTPVFTKQLLQLACVCVCVYVSFSTSLFMTTKFLFAWISFFIDSP